ncbi:hypothetical protein [Duganella qianjiadongensis]|uniref:Uncharacterized protein n=1 Tax=Duganella qianjiadongensis TaxID=2692176 RepID=A0ABW9VNX9_9BURK|nr:hypothetical protein [Duganella qianjiadongensis]MYM40149.1 hypothetical protein [Duganella qianjiadongensis]
MSTTNELPPDFSGIAQLNHITTNYETGITSVVVYTKYYRNGVLHREDGPSVLLEGKPHEYWVHGRQYSEEEYGHFLAKKALKEKLESKFGEKGYSQRGKI